MYVSEGKVEHIKLIAYWYEKSAKQENAYSQYQLGRLYYTGLGGIKDYKKSAYWTKKAYNNKNKDLLNTQTNAKQFWEKAELWKY